MVFAGGKGISRQLTHRCLQPDSQNAVSGQSQHSRQNRQLGFVNAAPLELDTVNRHSVAICPSRAFKGIRPTRTEVFTAWMYTVQERRMSREP
jgi:hypothetical protein